MQNSSIEKTNVGLIFRNHKAENPLVTTVAQYSIADESILEVVKEVDHPDEYYFPGDPIVFTITITNRGNKIIRNLFFSDPIEPTIIPAEGEEFDVCSSLGTVLQALNPIQVENITLEPEATCTITISGVIA